MFCCCSVWDFPRFHNSDCPIWEHSPTSTGPGPRYRGCRRQWIARLLFPICQQVTLELRCLFIWIPFPDDHSVHLELNIRNWHVNFTMTPSQKSRIPQHSTNFVLIGYQFHRYNSPTVSNSSTIRQTLWESLPLSMAQASSGSICAAHEILRRCLRWHLCLLLEASGRVG